MSLETIWKLVLQMLEASTTTLSLFFLTALFALPLGLFVALGRMSKRKIISYPIRLYLLLMRGTPLILQLIFIYYVPGAVLGYSLPRYWAGILTFTLNYAAYFAEIYRGGIESVGDGQYEAASVLGLNRAQTFVRIILPQVIKKIIPSMGNEFMTLVKDTALASVISILEIFRLAQSSASTNANILPIFIAGLFYLIMNSVVSMGFATIEKKLNYYK